MVSLRFKKPLSSSQAKSKITVSPVDTFAVFPYNDDNSNRGGPSSSRQRSNSDISNTNSAVSETLFSPTQETPGSSASSVYSVNESEQKDFDHPELLQILPKTSAATNAAASDDPIVLGSKFYKAPSSTSTPTLPLVIPPKCENRRLLARSVSTSSITNKVTYRHSRISSKQFAFLQDFSADLLEDHSSLEETAENRFKPNTAATIVEEQGPGQEQVELHVPTESESLNLSPILRLNIVKKSQNNKMEGLVKEFEQELSALDGIGEFDNELDMSLVSTSSTTATSNEPQKMLQPSAIPYSSSNSNLSSDSGYSPSPSSSYYESGTPMSRGSPAPTSSAHQQQQSPSGVKGKQSMMFGKFKSFGKRVISGDGPAAASTTAAAVDSSLNTPMYHRNKSPSVLTPPDSTSQVKTPVISMRFNSEKNEPGS